jgi:hypothetical protein
LDLGTTSEGNQRQKQPPAFSEAEGSGRANPSASPAYHGKADGGKKKETCFPVGKTQEHRGPRKSKKTVEYRSDQRE